MTTTIGECLTASFAGEWGSEPTPANATVYRSTDIDDEGNIVGAGAQRRLPIGKLASKRLRDGDVLIEGSGGGPGKPVGRVAYFDAARQAGSAACSNFFKTLRPARDRVDPRFLVKKLGWFYKQPPILALQQQTTGIINLKFEEYLASEIAIPESIPEQRQIAQILDTLDTAIHETEAIIAKLQAVKQGLLHDLLTRGIAANGELRPPQAEAPQLYKQSPLGWIPKEWGVEKVSDAGSVKLGRQRSPAFERGSYLRPYLRVANVFDGKFDYSDVLEMNFTPVEQEVFSVVPGDILLNEGQSLDLVGRSALYLGTAGVFCFQNTLVRFRSFPDTVPAFARLVFKYWLDTGRFAQVAKQTTSVAHLGADRFADMDFPLVVRDEQEKIANLADVQAKLTFDEVAQLEKLRFMKAALMDDLLTGRVRVTPLLEAAAT